MSRVLSDFTEEELKRFQDAFGDNMELEDLTTVILHQPESDYEEFIRFVKIETWRGISICVEHEESESCVEDRGDSIVILDPIWWQKVDIDALFEDYKNGVDIDPMEYTVYVDDNE